MKALASDFDNTLHFRDGAEGYIKEEDLKAIEAFREKGNLFGLCTGRPLYGFGRDLEGGPKLDFMIVSTGALIVKPDHNVYDTVYEELITVEEVASIQKACEGRGVLYIHADGHIFTLQYKRPEYPQQIVLPSVADLEGKHITGISVWTVSDSTAAVLTKDLNDLLGETLSVYQNVNWLDVVHKGVSKGEGAMQAKSAFGADVIGGIGDSFNDIPLLKAADVSFTFPTSAPEVQEAADYIVESVAEALKILDTIEA